MDIIFDSYGDPYLFMEDRFHKLRFISKLKSKTAVEILGVIEGVQSVYVKYGHKIQSVMSDNEAVFRSL